jgi:hypothetical protein
MERAFYNIAQMFYNVKGEDQILGDSTRVGNLYRIGSRTSRMEKGETLSFLNCPDVGTRSVGVTI